MTAPVTTSTELVRYGGPSAAIVRASLPERMQYAEALANAGLLPDAYRRQPANVLIAIEKGEALGIHHMVAMEGIHVIKGKSTLSAQLMRALIQRAGHQFDLVEQTRDRAVVECARRERPDRVFRHEWTVEDARVAELLAGPNEANWRKYRKAMLAARVTSEAANAHFSDVLAGMVYTPEELGAVVDEDGRIVDVTATATVHQPAPNGNGNGHANGGSNGNGAAHPSPSTPQPPWRPEQEQDEWAAEWARRFDGAETLDELTALGRAVQAAERSGHCQDGEPYRRLLRTRAGEMPATETHLTRLHAALGEKGVTIRDDKLAAVGRIVGRQIGSTSELTCVEANRAYDEIRIAPPELDLVTGQLIPEGAGIDPAAFAAQLDATEVA